MPKLEVTERINLLKKENDWTKLTLGILIQEHLFLLFRMIYGMIWGEIISVPGHGPKPVKKEP